MAKSNKQRKTECHEAMTSYMGESARAKSFTRAFFFDLMVMAGMSIYGRKSRWLSSKYGQKQGIYTKYGEQASL